MFAASLLAGVLTFSFYQGGFSEGAYVRGQFTAVDRNGDGVISAASNIAETTCPNCDVLSYHMTFSGNSRVPAFTHQGLDVLGGVWNFPGDGEFEGIIGINHALPGFELLPSLPWEFIGSDNRTQDGNGFWWRAAWEFPSCIPGCGPGDDFILLSFGRVVSFDIHSTNFRSDVSGEPTTVAVCVYYPRTAAVLADAAGRRGGLRLHPPPQASCRGLPRHPIDPILRRHLVGSRRHLLHGAQATRPWCSRRALSIRTHCSRRARRGSRFARERSKARAATRLF